MKVRTTRLRAAAALLSIGAVVTACGSSPTDTQAASSSSGGATGIQAVYDAVKGLTGQKRQDKLLDLAKKAGGQIGFYHSGDLTPEVEAFQNATGIKVNDFQATSERVMERVSQEKTAGQQGSDVVLGGSDDMANLRKQGGLEKLDSPTLNDVPKGYKSDSDVSPIAIMEMPTYNTDAVKAGQLPKTWEDLFKNPPGRLGLEITDTAWYETLIRKYFVAEKGMSEKDAIALVTKGFAGAQQVDGHTLVANLLASGQYDYVPNLFAHYVPGLKDSGAPISYDNLSPDMPPFVVTLSQGLTKGGPNPAGGLLLIEWLMGADGQKVIAGQKYVPTSSAYTGSTLLKQYPKAILQDLYLTDTDQDKQTWQSNFDALLQSIGGTPASK